MVGWWKRASGIGKIILIASSLAVTMLVALAISPFIVPCETPAEASERPLMVRTAEERQEQRRKSREDWDRRWEERQKLWDQMEAESRARVAEEIKRDRPVKRRRVRKFAWESPAETRGKLWNVPQEESDQATLTAFLRICIAEADGNVRDCVGIWQVLKNIRRRSCNREYVRRITECDEDGETMLSVMRRSQRHILGMIPARNKRAVWIRELTTDCEPPEAWPGDLNQWDAQYTKRCQNTVALGRLLIKGELPPSVPGHRVAWLPGRPITWGGRCETKRAACDDVIACRRGLARIPDTDTYNAFWCRPGTSGCRDDVDPICRQYLRLPEGKTFNEHYNIEVPPEVSSSTTPEKIHTESRAGVGS